MPNFKAIQEAQAALNSASLEATLNIDQNSLTITSLLSGQKVKLSVAQAATLSENLQHLLIAFGKGM